MYLHRAKANRGEISLLLLIVHFPPDLELKVMRIALFLEDLSDGVFKVIRLMILASQSVGEGHVDSP